LLTYFAVCFITTLARWSTPHIFVCQQRNAESPAYHYLWAGRMMSYR
jgi:hypothetical protein